MSKILDNLYLGSYADAKNQGFLKRKGITHIVTVGIELKTHYPENYKYLYIPAYDTPAYKLNVYFEEITEFIHKAMTEENGTVFVHCYWGISRSTTSVLAYLIKYHRMTPLKARRFVLAKRSIIFPNGGFVKQLETFAKKLGVIEIRSMNNKPGAHSAYSSVSATFPSGSLEEGKFEGIKESMLSARSVEKETILNDKKKVDLNHHCRNCAIKIFNTQDIIHNVTKQTSKLCDGVYLKYMSWMGELKTAKAKLFCPNKKCSAIVGVASKTGGKCMCGTQIDKIYSIYLNATVTAKPKVSKPDN